MGGVNLRFSMVQVIEYKKKAINTAEPTKLEEMKKKLRKEHEKLVKGMFEFVDAQGGWLEFTYRWFKEDPLMKLRLVHGEVTELPMGIVKHLNNTVKKVRQMPTELPKDGKISQPVTKVSRVRFTPMDVI